MINNLGNCLNFSLFCVRFVLIIVLYSMWIIWFLFHLYAKVNECWRDFTILTFYSWHILCMDFHLYREYSHWNIYSEIYFWFISGLFSFASFISSVHAVWTFSLMQHSCDCYRQPVQTNCYFHLNFIQRRYIHTQKNESKNYSFPCPF